MSQNNAVARVRSGVDNLLRKGVPSYRLKRKHDEELAHWQRELRHLRAWFHEGTTDWWGVRAPTPAQKVNRSDLWISNAVMTLHAMRPAYTEELRIDRSLFKGKRILEIGCGPLAPSLEFEGCERHCVDPLVNVYMDAGWPLFDYDAKFVNCGGESLPYADDYFDAVISVNALDHVDDFEETAREMQRVLRPGGGLFFEVEYHAPTIAEPIELTDTRVMQAFSKCKLSVAVDRSGREMFEALVRRFDLIPNQFDRFRDDRFVTWHGIRVTE